MKHYFISAQDHHTQQYKSNLDFLQHESGTPPPKRDYVANFPSLPSKSITSSSPSPSKINSNVQSQLSGKRDYVSPDFPSLKPLSANRNNGQTFNPTSTPASALSQQSNAKRDYVAPDFPPLKPALKNQGYTEKPNTFTTHKNPQPTNAKRDYVAPQFTTPASTSTPSKNKVKDLINFFGGHNNDNKKPSYSSVAGGGQNTVSTTRTTQPVPTSSTVGLDKHGPISSSSLLTTAKPTSSAPSRPLSPVTNTRNPATQRPVNTVMPSSFVNNKKDQGTANGPSDLELESLSEELLRKDVNNAAKLITVNVQERTTFQSKDDKAPQP